MADVPDRIKERRGAKSTPCLTDALFGCIIARSTRALTPEVVGAPTSECDLVAAFQRQDFPRLVGAGDFEPQSFDDLARPADLLGV